MPEIMLYAVRHLDTKAPIDNCEHITIHTSREDAEEKAVSIINVVRIAEGEPETSVDDDFWDDWDEVSGLSDLVIDEIPLTPDDAKAVISFLTKQIPGSTKLAEEG